MVFCVCINSLVCGCLLPTSPSPPLPFLPSPCSSYALWVGGRGLGDRDAFVPNGGSVHFYGRLSFCHILMQILLIVFCMSILPSLLAVSIFVLCSSDSLFGLLFSSVCFSFYSFCGLFSVLSLSPSFYIYQFRTVTEL